MSKKPTTPQDRREFLAQLGIATAMLAGSATTAPLAAQPGEVVSASRGDKWDTSWLDQLAKAQYRVVFDATNVSDGFALDLTSTFLDHYHEVHGTSDEQLRAVIVMRQLGTPLALGDAIWDKFALGEELKINDRLTHQPAKRNPFLKPNPSTGSSDSSLETLHSRGTILLLCNIAMNNWSSRHAEMVKRPVDEVREEVRTNLVPGVIVMPSGIFSLIRAQNAGCAYMRGA
jgi:intracellular sulfur oxidation DsrE/DsrF family protein